MARMRVTFDRGANAVYIYLAEGEAAAGGTYVCGEDEEVNRHDVARHARGIHLDFNRKGRLIGIEVLNATEKLPYELLEKAERL